MLCKKLSKTKCSSDFIVWYYYEVFFVPEPVIATATSKNQNDSNSKDNTTRELRPRTTVAAPTGKILLCTILRPTILL